MCNNCLTTTKTIVNIDTNRKVIWRIFTDKEKKEKILQNKLSYDYFTPKGRIRYATCGNVITNEIYMDSSNNLYSKVGKAISCNDRLCPICSKKRMNQKRIKLMDMIIDKELYKKHIYYMVFTLKHTNKDAIESLINKLWASTKKIKNLMNNAKKGRNKSTVFGFIDGAYRAIETTKTVNWWNLHINYLIFSDQEIELEQARDLKGNLIYNDKWPTMTNKRIQDEWYNITSDSYITSIQKVDMKGDKENIYKHISEIVKYTMKDDWLTVKDKIEFATAVKWKRISWSWGSLYNNKDDESIDDIDMEDGYIDDIIDDIKDKETKEDETKKIDYSNMCKVATVYYKLWLYGSSVAFSMDRITYTLDGIRSWIDLTDRIPIKYLNNKDDQKGLSAIVN